VQRYGLITVRIVRASVLAIGNTIAIAVAIHAIGDTIAVSISPIYPATSVGRLVSDAAG
jgi:hypothetical protein